MKTREELYRTTEYWLETIQNNIFSELYSYMETNNLNKSGLAKELGFSRSYITQVLNGNFNFSLKKLIELSLAMKQAPKLEFEDIATYTSEKEHALDFMEEGFQISYNMKDVEMKPTNGEAFKEVA